MSETTRHRLSARERRNQLVRVGRETFAEKGYDATSVEEIAERAGISKPVIYEHFGGKEGLYAVIVDREMGYVTSRISAAISTGTARERLEGAVTAFFLCVQERPDGFAVLSRDSPTPSGMANLLAEVADQVTNVFASEFEKAGYDTSMASLYAQGIIGNVAFVAEWWQEHPDMALEQVAAHTNAMIWAGLRNLPREPTPPDLANFT